MIRKGNFWGGDEVVFFLGLVVYVVFIEIRNLVLIGGVLVLLVFFC